MNDLIDRKTGEIIDAPDPQTLDEVNHAINTFVHHLSLVSKELITRSRELQQASTAYKIYRATLIQSSSAGEAKQRDADAEANLYATAASDLIDTDATVSIGELKDTLEMEVRILRDRGHDYRSAMSALQTVASNLRAELQALNAMPA